MRITESSLRRTIRDVIRESINEQEAGEKETLEGEAAIERIKTSWKRMLPRFKSTWESFKKPDQSITMIYSFKINKDGSVSNVSWKIEKQSEGLGDMKQFVAALTKALSDSRFCDANQQFAIDYDINESKLTFD